MTEDKEKSSVEGHRVSTHEEGVNMPPDPDAHRTDEEKAEIVCHSPQPGRYESSVDANKTHFRTANSFAVSISCSSHG